MPNIGQYNPNIPDLQPNNLGASALEQAARVNRIDANEAGSAIGGGISSLGQPASNLYDRLVTQPEITKLTSQAAVGFAALTSQYNQAVTQAGSDPSKVGASFDANSITPFLDQLTDSATTSAGRDFVQKYGDSLRQHFGEKLAADQTTFAGAQAVQGIQNMTNGYAAAANADPSSASMGMGQMEAGVHALVGALNLDPTQAAAMENEILAKSQSGIAAAALEGAIVKNPTQAQSDLASGKFNNLMLKLNPAEQESIRSYAAVQVKAGAQADKAAAAEQAKQDKTDYNTQVSQVMASGQQKDGSVFYGPDAIQSIYGGPKSLAFTPYGQAHPTEVRNLYKSMVEANDQAQSGVNIPNDPSTYQDFQNRAFLPDGNNRALTKDEIAQAVVSHHISAKAGAFFDKAIGDKDPTKVQDEGTYNKWLTSLKPFIVPSGNSANPSVPNTVYGQHWVQFMQDVRQRYETERGQGLTTAQLLNPASKDYILNSFPMRSYQVTDEDAAKYSGQDIFAPPSQVPPVTEEQGGPVNANESLTQFFTTKDFGATGAGSQFTLSTDTGVKFKAGMSMDDLAKAVQ